MVAFGDLPNGRKRRHTNSRLGDVECHGILPTIPRISVTLSAVEASALATATPRAIVIDSVESSIWLRRIIISAKAESC